MNGDIKQQVCLRCTWIWYPKKPKKPKVCPHCKSPYYNIPRKVKA